MTLSPAAGRRRTTAHRTEAAPAEVLEERIVPASLGFPQDLVGFNNVTGVWQVGVSNGVNAFTTATWASWNPSARWDSVLEGDFNNDGRTDVIGLTHGTWWVGLSTGNSFSTSNWGAWNDLVWQDVAVADLNADGRDDIFARFGNGYYAALTIFDPVQNRLRFGTPSLWATTGGVVYRATFLADVTGDNRADLVLLDNLNRWIVGRSLGNTFGGAELWTNLSGNQWPSPGVPWQALMTVDIDGALDGNSARDVIGFVNGAWWFGFTTGDSFTVQPLSTPWRGDLTWVDLRIGDFDGNGLNDLAGRVSASGVWYVTNLFPNSGPVTRSWGQWSPNATWQDVRVGDFNGDGRDDIAGRYLGYWWVAQSNGTTFTNVLWTKTAADAAKWNSSAWRAVATVQLNNVAQPGPVAQAVATDSTPDAIFWTQSKEDDEFAAALLSSAV